MQTRQIPKSEWSLFLDRFSRQHEGWLVKLPDDHVTHSINHPTEVSLEQTDEGADVALSIKSADGTTALLSFRAAVVPETVDAVAA